MPANLHATRHPTGAVVFWDAVDGATSYQVYLQHPDGTLDTVSTGELGVSFTYPDLWGAMSFSVSASNVHGSSRQTAPLVVPVELPALSVELVDRTAVLQWDASLGPSTIARGTDPHDLWHVGQSTDGRWVDDTLTEEADSYFYFQVATGGPTLFFLTAVYAVRVFLYPPAGLAVASLAPGAVELSWRPAPRAKAYAVLTRPVPTADWTTAATTAAVVSPPLDCGGALACDFAVATIDPLDRTGNPSPPLHVVLQ